jgi:hypothetical protein
LLLLFKQVKVMAPIIREAILWPQTSQTTKREKFGKLICHHYKKMGYFLKECTTSLPSPCRICFEKGQDLTVHTPREESSQPRLTAKWESKLTEEVGGYPLLSPQRIEISPEKSWFWKSLVSSLSSYWIFYVFPPCFPLEGNFSPEPWLLWEWMGNLKPKDSLLKSPAALGN